MAEAKFSGKGKIRTAGKNHFNTEITFRLNARLSCSKISISGKEFANDNTRGMKVFLRILIR